MAFNRPWYTAKISSLCLFLTTKKRLFSQFRGMLFEMLTAITFRVRGYCVPIILMFEDKFSVLLKHRMQSYPAFYLKRIRQHVHCCRRMTLKEGQP